MSYEIEISYSTGSSFHTEDCIESVGHVWEDLTQAKKALQYIKEHYKACDEQYNDKTIIEKHGGEPWCKKEHPSYSLLVPNDEGNLVSIHCFWVGYFESLYGADIVSSKDDSMGFTL
jgi:hypothetical protein